MCSIGYATDHLVSLFGTYLKIGIFSTNTNNEKFSFSILKLNFFSLRDPTSSKQLSSPNYPIPIKELGFYNQTD